MSEVNRIICDMCGKPMFEKSGSTGYRLRGAKGKSMAFRSYFGLLTEDEIDVCDVCWDRMKQEMRKGAGND